MANIMTVGLDRDSASLLERALAAGHHRISHMADSAAASELPNYDIVFAAGEGKQYLPLLRNVRTTYPGLAFVVVTRIPETSDWLDALEAGATDYCSTPFDTTHMSWLMESAVPGHRAAAG